MFLLRVISGSGVEDGEATPVLMERRASCSSVESVCLGVGLQAAPMLCGASTSTGDWGRETRTPEKVKATSQEAACVSVGAKAVSWKEARVPGRK